MVVKLPILLKFSPFWSTNDTICKKRGFFTVQVSFLISRFFLIIVFYGYVFFPTHAGVLTLRGFDA